MMEPIEVWVIGYGFKFPWHCRLLAVYPEAFIVERGNEILSLSRSHGQYRAFTDPEMAERIRKIEEKKWKKIEATRWPK